jgi:hypothetical protein
MKVAQPIDPWKKSQRAASPQNSGGPIGIIDKKKAFCPETRPTHSRGGVMVETQHPTEPHSSLHWPIGRD